MDTESIEGKQRVILDRVRTDMLMVERALPIPVAAELRYYRELAILDHQLEMALGMKMRWVPVDYPQKGGVK